MLMLRELARDKGASQQDLADIMGVSQSAISLMMRGNQLIKLKHIEKLTAKFGKEVIDAYTVPDTPRQIPTQVTEAEVTFYEPKVVEEVKEEILEAESFPIIPAEVSTKAGCDIRTYIEENADELEHINPSQELSGAKFGERVLKNSMFPTFVPNDTVFLSFIKDKNSIVDGAMYYFALKSKPPMIRTVKIEGERIRLIAMNPTYGDIITTFDDIRSVANIVGMLRLTFSDISGELNELRKQKDKQIEELITELRKQNERMDAERARQDKLIERLLER